MKTLAGILAVAFFMVSLLGWVHLSKLNDDHEHLRIQHIRLKDNVSDLSWKLRKLSDKQYFSAETKIPVEITKLYQDKGVYALATIDPRLFHHGKIPMKLNVRVQLPEWMEEWSVETVYGFTDDSPLKEQPVHVTDPREKKYNSWWFIDSLDEDKPCKLFIYIFACKEGGNCTCADCECSCWVKHCGCRTLNLEKDLDSYLPKIKTDLQVSLFWTR